MCAGVYGFCLFQQQTIVKIYTKWSASKPIARIDRVYGKDEALKQ